MNKKRIQQIKCLFTLVFAACTLFHAARSYAQTTQVTISQENVPMERVMNEIEKQTGYLFLSNNDVDIRRNVSVRIENGTLAEVFTQSFVVPYLIPMLENAGAVVFTPRERDWQRHEVIVDNNTCTKGSHYLEVGDKKYRWQDTDKPGFAQKYQQYPDNYNPFTDGTARFIPTQGQPEKAFAEWIPDIPEKGRYAVYVSYQTLPESVSDAKYLVFHNGGVTEFIT